MMSTDNQITPENIRDSLLKLSFDKLDHLDPTKRQHLLLNRDKYSGRTAFHNIVERFSLKVSAVQRCAGRAVTRVPLT